MRQRDWPGDVGQENASTLTSILKRFAPRTLAIASRWPVGANAGKHKAVTKETVQRILQESLSTDTLLCTRDGVSVLDLPRGMRRLELKLAMGKISVSNIRRTKDHKYSAEKLLDEWIYRYCPEKANERYAHLSVIVGNVCQEAYDSAYTPSEPFGQVMLNNVRQRLRSRLAGEPDSFFGCKYEHLLGMAGILTELCDVWWSEESEISEDVQV